MKQIRKQIAGLSIAIGALVAVAGAAQADGTSDGSTAASGDTLVTMTVPKFAEVQGATGSVGFTVTSADYAADFKSNANLIGFKVRTNSTAGLTVKVKGAASPTLLNGDIVVSSDDGSTSALTLGTTAATIWTNGVNIDELPVANNVNLGVRINNLHRYTSTGASTYTNTLTFTVLPN
ncbi:MAG TPA: hypothetical protein VGB77_08110 [Abditibacteriaceae bacterium]|jgi:hypothetical protein